MADHIYSNLRNIKGDAVDVICSDGKIAAMVRAGSVQHAAAAQLTDGKGQLVLPALVESHVHLDKTLWGLPRHRRRSGGASEDHFRHGGEAWLWC